MCGSTELLFGTTLIRASETYIYQILYSRKLSREKTFANFAVLRLFTKVFSVKFGGVASLCAEKRAIRESFLRENRIFHQFAKVFSLESFLLYSIGSDNQD